MFEKIKKWYELGLWNKAMVEQAVGKGLLTQAEMESFVSEVGDGES